MTRPSRDAKPREKKQYALFMKRTASIYSNMRNRRRKLEGQDDKMLPFTIDRLRGSIEDCLGSSCVYCDEKITVKNVSVDHSTPVERGGAWKLSNLDIICRSCNLAKNNLTRNEFQELMQTLRGFPVRVQNGVLGRLKAGATVVRLRFLR
jgi:5-methylcytosine-specific restriction endonuclease McrA